MKKINIAIDGPSGAGKSSVSKALAVKLNYVHLDTGAMYRSVAYFALQNGLKMNEEDKIEELIKSMNLNIYPDGRIFINDEEVTSKIRTDEISMAASDVSKLKKIRAALVKMQQDISKDGGYIVDGRDICSVVLPNAEVKVFLTASAAERAQRRFLQNVSAGLEADFKSILKDIEARDYQDSHRENSPLKKTDDAVLVDSSDMDKDEVVDAIMMLYDRAIKNDWWKNRYSW